MDLRRVDEERSSRSSRLRTRLMIVLADLKVAHAGELAEAARMSTQTVRMIMEGAPPRFSVRRSPLALGLAVKVPHDELEVYAITERGAEWAAARRHRGRSARRLGAALP
jgi:predicted transcriptional regulator with HTH domain